MQYQKKQKTKIKRIPIKKDITNEKYRKCAKKKRNKKTNEKTKKQKKNKKQKKQTKILKCMNQSTSVENNKRTKKR